MGKGELSADLFAGKYHRCNRRCNNRDCREEEKEVSNKTAANDNGVEFDPIFLFLPEKIFVESFGKLVG